MKDLNVATNSVSDELLANAQAVMKAETEHAAAASDNISLLTKRI